MEFCVNIKKLQSHDALEVERWFLAYSDSVYTYIYYRVGKDKDLAGDIVQDVFLKALDQIDQFDPDRGRMFVWLTCLSKNIIRKALLDKSRSLSGSSSPQAETLDDKLLNIYERIATEPLPDEVLERRETAELVQMTLISIPGNYKEVLDEFYYKQKSLKEISIKSGVTEGAAKSLLFRARKAFKESYTQLATSLGVIELSGGICDE